MWKTTISETSFGTRFRAQITPVNPKKLIQDYFHFTRNDRAGILVILAVMLGVILLPELMEKRSGDRMQATGYREQEAGGRQQEAGSREQVCPE